MKIALSIVGAIAVIAIIIGLLFKVMHWPGSAIMLVAGAGFAIVFVVMLVVHINTNKPGELTGNGFPTVGSSY